MFKRLFLASFLILSITHLSGCQLFHKNEAANTDAAQDSDADSDTAGNVPTGIDQLDNMGPKPLIDNYRPISVVTPSGLKLVGTLYVPGLSPYKAPPPPNPDAELKPLEDAPADTPKNDKPVPPAKVQYPLIILMHMLSGNRWDWKTLPKELTSQGYAVLAFDLRGHGDSVYRGKQLKVWREFDHDDWQRMTEDPGALTDYISKQPDLNMVNTHQVAILGASVGANAAVDYASEHPDQVKALVLLSPGLEYYGLETFDPMTHYENPVYFAVSQEDSYAASSTQRLYKFALGKKKIKVFQDIGHGTDMLDNDADLTKDIIAWLKEVYPPQTIQNAAPPATANVVQPAEKADEKKAETQKEKKDDKKPTQKAKVPPEKTDKKDKTKTEPTNKDKTKPTKTTSAQSKDAQNSGSTSKTTTKSAAQSVKPATKPATTKPAPTPAKVTVPNNTQAPPPPPPAQPSSTDQSGPITP